MHRVTLRCAVSRGAALCCWCVTLRWLYCVAVAQENSKIHAGKFSAWANDTAEGQEFVRVASQHFAAEQQARVREVRRGMSVSWND